MMVRKAILKTMPLYVVNIWTFIIKVNRVSNETDSVNSQYIYDEFRNHPTVICFDLWFLCSTNPSFCDGMVIVALAWTSKFDSLKQEDYLLRIL